MTSLEQLEQEIASAEDEVRRIDAQMRELHDVKRAANHKRDVLCRQREALMRGDPTRKRMVIGS